MEYTLLHGALKNVGDFLIYERAKALLRWAKPDVTFLELSRYESLEPYLDQVNRTEAVILCGGPGYRENFYPGVFALTEDLRKIKPPIVPFGLGWSGYPAGHPERFHFSESSLQALRFIHRRIPASSCRDVLTEEVLHRHEVTNVTMTGCPAWYHLPHVGMEFVPPEQIRRVVVTTPRRLRLLPQAMVLLKEVRRLFPKAERYCVFHRGLRKDRYTTLKKSVGMHMLWMVAKGLGFSTINAAYDLSKIDFYQNCDLHIGYRVHAQIDFLSYRKPSLLLCEDGRGEGLSHTLGMGDIRAWDNPRAIEQTIARLQGDMEHGFSRFHGIIRRMNETFERAMAPFLERLP